MIMDYGQVSGWALAVILILMMFSGLIEPRRSVSYKLKVKDEQITDLKAAIEIKDELISLQTRTISEMSPLLANQNDVLKSIASAIHQRGI
jgi:hypothetical protein